MAISSLANSDPAHSLGPPPNGMKFWLLVAVAVAVVDPRSLCYTSIQIISPNIKDGIRVEQF